MAYQLYPYHKLYPYVAKQYHHEFAHLPAAQQQAHIFERTLEILPVHIREGDCFAGWYGFETLPQDIAEVFETIDLTPRMVPLSEPWQSLRQELRSHFALKGGFTAGHYTLDYETIITKGMKHYVEKVNNALALAAEGSEKQQYLQAMHISLQALSIMTNKFVAEAEKQGHSWIADACKRLPMEPARDFFEALQSIWLMHALVPIQDNAYDSISVGRFDQYLYPFYEQAIRDGISEDELCRWIKQLFLYLDNYGDGSSAFNIGGLSKDGHDQMNNLSRLVIRAEKESLLRAPLLVARISKETPDDIMLELVDGPLFEIGKPTFYSEEMCRAAVLNYKRDIPYDTAVNFAVNSCMGFFIPGQEIADMWGYMFNTHLPLEMALNHGAGLHHAVPAPVIQRPTQPVESLDSLFNAYACHMFNLFTLLVQISRESELVYAEELPNPLLSAMTDDCIEKGLDRIYGARYLTVTIESMAFAHTADAITAIDELVFQKKRYTLDDFVQGARAGFEGYEQLRADIAGCGKYGTASEAANQNARRLLQIYENIVERFDYGNINFIGSTHTLDHHVSWGEALTYTLMDGHPGGTPVNKNAGPSSAVLSPVITDMVLAAAQLDQPTLSGGNPLDFYFDRSTLNRVETRKKVAALIRTYFALGGMQAQVNSINPDVLEAAIASPEEYHHLIVKRGGYSLRFNELTESVKRDFVETFRKQQG